MSFTIGVSFCRGNYTKEIEWYKKSANQGYATAQYALGFAYEHGDGVPQDYSVAYSWYKKAADQGHGMSLLRCGNFWAKGIGVESKNGLAANSYYAKAYSSSDNSAKTLAKSYMKDLFGTDYQDPGIGVEYGSVEEVWGIENNFVSTNGQKGILIHAELFVNALKSKHVSYEIKFFDSHGNVIKDFEQKGDISSPSYDRSTYENLRIFVPYSAYNYWNNIKFFKIFIYGNYRFLSKTDLISLNVSPNNNSNQSNVSSSNTLPEFYKILRENQNNMSVEELEKAGDICINLEDYINAFKCYKLAADKGSTHGMYNLAICYLKGDGCTMDYDKFLFYP